MNSALYAGRVQHRRLAPVRNSFRYGFYQLLLDLEELDELDRRIPFFTNDRPGPVSFRDQDYLDGGEGDLRHRFRAWVEGQGTELGAGDRVLLLTQPRVLGYVFNPVSHYYVLAPSGELRFVVAEVNNTFGDRHAYLLDDLERLGEHGFAASRGKTLHVSPFIGMDDVSYRWRLTEPGERLVVHMDEYEEGEKFFDATLTLERRPLTTATLAGALLRYPHVTIRTVALIHWQAFRLWWKRAPFFRRPAPPVGALRRREG